MINPRIIVIILAGLILSGCTLLNHTLDYLANDAPTNHFRQTQGMEQRKAMDYYRTLNDAIVPGTKVCYTEALGIGIPALVQAELLRWKSGHMRVVIKDVSPTGSIFHGIAMKAGDILDVEPHDWFLCRP